MSDMHPDDESEDVVSQLEGKPSLRELVLEVYREVIALRQEVSMLRSQSPYQSPIYTQPYTTNQFPTTTFTTSKTAPQTRSRPVSRIERWLFGI